MLSIDYRNLFTRTLNSKSLQYNKHRAERRAQLYTSLSDYTICVCFVTLSFSLAHLIPNPCSTTNTGQSAGHSYTSLSDYTISICACFVSLSSSLAHLIPSPCSTTNTGQSAGSRLAPQQEGAPLWSCVAAPWVWVWVRDVYGYHCWQPLSD